MSKLTYEEACCAMQAGVGLKETLGGSLETTPKHLRVGVNSAMAEQAALARLLIAKGVITDAEYSEAMANGMREEVALYERELSARVGKKVTLGYDKTEGRGCATIEGGLPCGSPTSSSKFAPCTLQRGHDGLHRHERAGTPEASGPGGVDRGADILESAARAKGGVVAPILPVDRSARSTLHGMDPDGDDHREIEPATGMQKDYVILSDEERGKGFVRPVRQKYKHLTCGAVTTMGLKLSETYARDPGFYSGTFCAHCRNHFPVGADGEFVWDSDGSKVGT